MSKGYNARKNKGYEIQLYDGEGNNSNVIGCDTLEDVARVLINVCNGNVKGNFPTIWKDGELIKNN